jgi:hypothetical protein
MENRNFYNSAAEGCHDNHNQQTQQPRDRRIPFAPVTSAARLSPFNPAINQENIVYGSAEIRNLEHRRSRQLFEDNDLIRSRTLDQSRVYRRVEDQRENIAPHVLANVLRLEEADDSAQLLGLNPSYGAPATLMSNEDLQNVIQSLEEENALMNSLSLDEYEDMRGETTQSRDVEQCMFQMYISTAQALVTPLNENGHSASTYFNSGASDIHDEYHFENLPTDEDVQLWESEMAELESARTTRWQQSVAEEPIPSTSQQTNLHPHHPVDETIYASSEQFLESLSSELDMLEQTQNAQEDSDYEPDSKRTRRYTTLIIFYYFQMLYLNNKILPPASANVSSKKKNLYNFQKHWRRFTRF